MNQDKPIIGIDPAAPNGDASAIAIAQGNRIHKVIFDKWTKRQLPPLTHQGTVTGRITGGFKPNMWQTPKTPSGHFSTNAGSKNRIYLFRDFQVVYQAESVFALISMDYAHSLGQPGDVMVTLSYMGKYRAYFWAGKKKRCWRRVDSRKYPDLMPQLRAALLLQA
jgi:hypothetical protein